MTKVHLVNDARVLKVRLGLDGATSIVPLRAAVLQLLAPPTSVEWQVPRPPGATISFALHPDLAREIAHDLLNAANELDRKRK